ncbi:hypothetical protein V5O48_008962 [Marasmius crinis-equi]|uniref:Ribonuclease H1 N-terminal domain-containing protein n=1 Tax=Marasmius crinis-equi TaxID=585013 RepID=A0ABR3FCK8_9AGAR
MPSSPIILSSDESDASSTGVATDTDSDNPDHDVDWDHIFPRPSHASPLSAHNSAPPPSPPSPPPSPPPENSRHDVARTSPEPPLYTVSAAEEAAAYYARTFVVPVPAPESITPPARLGRRRNVYAVTAGRRVGVFGDWSTVSAIAQGFSGCVQQGFTSFGAALAAYSEAYYSYQLKIIPA